MTTCLLLLSVAGYAQQSAVVSRVYDGDTYQLKTADTAFTVRLAGLDAPESQVWYTKDKAVQPGGKYVSDSVRAMLRGQAVTFRTYGKDRFERPLVVIYLRGERLDNLLIRSGLAWYEPGAPKGAGLPYGKTIQQEAQADGRGIFNQKRFPGRAIRPSTFRRNHNH